MARRKKEQTAEKKLQQLTKLQSLHTKTDYIQVLKGELPMEVADLEDEIEGLNTRLRKTENDVVEAKETISGKTVANEESKALITKYDKQLNSVKNNREFDALSKEIELQNLNIMINEKKIRETTTLIEVSERKIEELKQAIQEKSENLKIKQKELSVIVKDTEKEEKELLESIAKLEEAMDPKLLKGYYRIRSTYKNGLAVVNVERDACGGCFGKIPPQTQSDIKLKQKITTCDHCGRILSDVLEIDMDDFIPASAMKNE